MNCTEIDPIGERPLKLKLAHDDAFLFLTKWRMRKHGQDRLKVASKFANAG
ncbi:hypothetical protein HLBENOHH_02364 [Aeromonas dhakensis]